MSRFNKMSDFALVLGGLAIAYPTILLATFIVRLLRGG